MKRGQQAPLPYAYRLAHGVLPAEAGDKHLHRHWPHRRIASIMQTPARYFPVQPGPLRMRAGLYRLGTDFGNGPRDAAYFQGDTDGPRYRQAKMAVLQHWPDRVQVDSDACHAGLHAAVAAWMRQALVQDLALTLPDGADYSALALAVQEDFAVIHIPDGSADRILAVAVCFPSGWRPERLLGLSFAEIHAPVPGLRAGAPLVRALVTGGPFVRFVWTISSDAQLDHHPDRQQRAALVAGHAFLRVERQVTVPFPAWSAALFLIRTYVYPFAVLTPAQRSVLANALRQMPAAIATYKGLVEAIPQALTLLR